MTDWDRQPEDALRRMRDARVAACVPEVLSSSPYWARRIGAGAGGDAATAGTRPQRIAGVADLAAFPPVAEHDVCPGGDPAGAAELVLQPDEAGWLAGASRGRFGGALLRRLVDRDGYRRAVETDVRPTSYVFDGLATRFPVASTRADLDLVARAGARMWRLAGLGPADVLVGAAPVASTAVHQALWLAAMAAGAPALFPGEDVAEVARLLRLVPATVLAAPSATAGDLLYDLAAAGAPLAGLRTLLLLGAPDPAERAIARDALEDAGAGAATPVALHVPSGHRLAWVECRESAATGGGATGRTTGLHTYPDLEVVEAVDPETGDAPAASGPVELAVTQLGMRGSALLRWRTGDLLDAPPDEAPCPACGRRVPRVGPGLRRGALAGHRVDDGERPVDLRAVTATLHADPDVRDFRVALDDGKLAVGYLPASGADIDELRVDLAERLAAAAGVAPAVLVPMAEGAGPAAFTGAPGQLTARVVVRGRADRLG